MITAKIKIIKDRFHCFATINGYDHTFDGNYAWEAKQKMMEYIQNLSQKERYKYKINFVNE